MTDYEILWTIFFLVVCGILYLLWKRNRKELPRDDEE